MHPMELLGDVRHVEPYFGLFGVVLESVQDRCLVCTKCTIGSEIILDAHDELLGDVSYVESCFGPFGYCVNVGLFRDSADLDAR
jgi:hypothetical protein